MKLTTTLERRPALPLILNFIGLDMGSFARRIARSLGYRKPRHISLENLKIPDSKIARDATELVESCSPTFLLNHSIRTYLFGLAVGKNIGLAPDEEVFYLASIMHDLGLLEKYDSDESFEINGAKAARQFALDAGLDQEKADMVHEAIALHAAVGIASKREPEIALVHFGAGVDVIGFRMEEIAPRTVNDIIEFAPRLNFKQEFAPLMIDQAERKPRCHIAGHIGLGFHKKIQKAPFVE